MEIPSFLVQVPRPVSVVAVVSWISSPPPLFDDPAPSSNASELPTPERCSRLALNSMLWGFNFSKELRILLCPKLVTRWKKSLSPCTLSLQKSLQSCPFFQDCYSHYPFSKVSPPQTKNGQLLTLYLSTMSKIRFDNKSTHFILLHWLSKVSKWICHSTIPLFNP